MTISDHTRTLTLIQHPIMRAACQCGWRGPHRNNLTDTQVDGIHHLADVLDLRIATRPVPQQGGSPCGTSQPQPQQPSAPPRSSYSAATRTPSPPPKRSRPQAYAANNTTCDAPYGTTGQR